MCNSSPRLCIVVNVTQTVQDVVKQIKLGIPLRIPTLLRQSHGSLIISSRHIASFIPILDSKHTVKSDSIVIKCGDYHCNAKVVPRTILILLGDASNDIEIELPADIAFYMILHPNITALPESSMT